MLMKVFNNEKLIKQTEFENSIKKLERFPMRGGRAKQSINGLISNSKFINNLVT